MFRNILVVAGFFLPAVTLQAQVPGDPTFRPAVIDFRRPVSELRQSNEGRLHRQEAARCPKQSPRIQDLLASTLGGVVTGAFVHAIAYSEENPEGRRRTRATFLGVGAAYGLTLGFLHPRRSCKFRYIPEALPDGVQRSSSMELRSPNVRP